MSLRRKLTVAVQGLPILKRFFSTKCINPLPPRCRPPNSASMLYQPLDRSSDEIRLLDTSATIQCRLSTSSLHPGSSLHPADDYIALSYIWGDESITKDIVINGEGKPVTTNLASGLQYIRSAMSPGAGSSSEWNGLPKLFWVDAICLYVD
jgi:hypothetical protein